MSENGCLRKDERSPPFGIMYAPNRPGQRNDDALGKPEEEIPPLTRFAPSVGMTGGEGRSETPSVRMTAWGENE